MLCHADFSQKNVSDFSNFGYAPYGHWIPPRGGRIDVEIAGIQPINIFHIPIYKSQVRKDLNLSQLITTRLNKMICALLGM